MDGGEVGAAASAAPTPVSAGSAAALPAPDTNADRTKRGRPLSGQGSSRPLKTPTASGSDFLMPKSKRFGWSTSERRRGASSASCSTIMWRHMSAARSPARASLFGGRCRRNRRSSRSSHNSRHSRRQSARTTSARSLTGFRRPCPSRNSRSARDHEQLSGGGGSQNWQGTRTRERRCGWAEWNRCPSTAAVAVRMRASLVKGWPCLTCRKYVSSRNVTFVVWPPCNNTAKCHGVPPLLSITTTHVGTLKSVIALVEQPIRVVHLPPGDVVIPGIRSVQARHNFGQTLYSTNTRPSKRRPTKWHDAPSTQKQTRCSILSFGAFEAGKDVDFFSIF